LNEKELCEYADRLLEVVSALPIDTPSGAVTVTMSIGVATATNAGDCDLSRIIKSADSSLYGAKNSGRNRMVMSLLPPISSGT
jgi:diguanylate cyclase (GGDEF)-like protein